MQFSPLLIQAALASAMGVPDVDLAKRAESSCSTITVTQITGTSTHWVTTTDGFTTYVADVTVTSTWPGHTFTSYATATATTTVGGGGDRNGGTGNGGGGGAGNGGNASGTGTGGSGSGGSGGRGQGGNA